MAGDAEQGGEARKSVECLAAQDMPSHYAKTGSASLKTLAPITTLSCLMCVVRARTLGLCTTATPCIEPHLISLNDAVVGASIQYSEWLGKGRKYSILGCYPSLLVPIDLHNKMRLYFTI